MSLIKEFSRDYHLTGGETGPQGEMPVTLVAERVIEVATLHADSLGVGYAAMIKENQAWVLSRLSIEMSRYPSVNEDYRLTTWVSSFNRRFSERDFEISTLDGRPLGYARTVWAAIDLSSRGVGELGIVTRLGDVIVDRQCPISKPPRLLPLGDGCEAGGYTFTYRDIDFNRHVNSVAYIRLLLDEWSLDFHDCYSVKRLDTAYIHEARYGIDVTLHLSTDADNLTDAEIRGADGTPLTRFRVEWSPRIASSVMK